MSFHTQGMDEVACPNTDAEAAKAAINNIEQQ